jgi:hypothetical protein
MQSFDWKPAWRMGMLCALCLFSALSAGQEQDDPQALRRQLDATEKQLTEVRASSVRAEGDLEALQARYAELYLEARDMANELEFMRLRMASLLAGDLDDAGQAEAASLAAYVNQALASHQALYAGIRDFGQYLGTVLDVLQPSEGLRREITGRYAVLERTVDRLQRMPSLVAGRGGQEDRIRRAGRVLAVNDELQIIVLDVGSDDSVRPGGTWRIVDDRAAVGLVRIIEVRPQFSAAVPIEGPVKIFSPGMKAFAEYALSDGQ